jgi:prepilin-type N-terminal cleavage/methylation domain-containing protein
MTMRNARRSSAGFTLVELLVVIAVIAVLAGLLLMAVQAAREAANRMNCGSNIKQVALALHQYHDVHRTLPVLGCKYRDPDATDPAAIGIHDAMPGWMLSILPQLERNDLFDRYDFEHASGCPTVIDPRSGGDPASPLEPSNEWIASRPIPAFLCPSDGSEGVRIASTWKQAPWGTTNYKGVLGANWEQRLYSTADLPYGKPVADPFRGDANGVFGPGNGKLQGTRFASVTDGLSQTFLVGEAIPDHQLDNAWQSSIPWGSGAANLATCAIPLNVDANCRESGRWSADREACLWEDYLELTYSFASRHPGGGQFALTDASVRFVPSSVDLDVYRSSATKSGGEAATLN